MGGGSHEENWWDLKDKKEEAYKLSLSLEYKNIKIIKII